MSSPARSVLAHGTSSSWAPIAAITVSSIPVAKNALMRRGLQVSDRRPMLAAADVDVLLSNHTEFDGSKRKLPALAARRAGQPHPYVVGVEAVARYLTLVGECATAGSVKFSPAQ